MIKSWLEITVLKWKALFNSMFSRSWNLSWISQVHSLRMQCLTNTWMSTNGSKNAPFYIKKETMPRQSQLMCTHTFKDWHRNRHRYRCLSSHWYEAIAMLKRSSWGIGPRRFKLLMTRFSLGLLSLRVATSSLARQVSITVLTWWLSILKNLSKYWK